MRTKPNGKKEADRYFAQTIKQFGSQAAIEEQLKAAGKTFDGWRAEMTQQTTAQAVMIRVLNAAPTDAEVQKYYEDNPKASEMPEQVHVRHILLLTMDATTHTPLPDDQVKAKKKQIDDILKQARAGADFAKLAKDILRGSRFQGQRRGTASVCARQRRPGSRHGAGV